MLFPIKLEHPRSMRWWVRMLWHLARIPFIGAPFQHLWWRTSEGQMYMLDAIRALASPLVRRMNYQELYQELVESPMDVRPVPLQEVLTEKDDKDEN